MSMKNLHVNKVYSVQAAKVSGTRQDVCTLIEQTRIDFNEHDVFWFFFSPPNYCDEFIHLNK